MDCPRKTVDDIIQYPSADHAVKRQQNKAGGNAHTPDPKPLCARTQNPEGIDGIFTARAPDIKFGKLNG